jgi:hypothetical protein
MLARSGAVALLLSIALGGCGLPVLQKRAYDFKSTALFRRPCDPAAEPGKLEIALNRCNHTRLLRMIELFMSIEEADPQRGRLGDTIEDVRAKGFTLYEDEAGKVRRPNTRVLYGNEALAAVGMAVSPPPLQSPEDVKAYADFMSQHYAEEYVERDMTFVADRICLNSRESLDIGEDRIFTVLWRQGRVFKRIIKGGPVNNPKQERALLICPGNFILDLLTGGINSTVKSFQPLR